MLSNFLSSNITHKECNEAKDLLSISKINIFSANISLNLKIIQKIKHVLPKDASY